MGRAGGPEGECGRRGVSASGRADPGAGHLEPKAGGSGSAERGAGLGGARAGGTRRRTRSSGLPGTAEGRAARLATGRGAPASGLIGRPHARAGKGAAASDRYPRAFHAPLRKGTRGREGKRRERVDLLEFGTGSPAGLLKKGALTLTPRRRGAGRCHNRRLAPPPCDGAKECVSRQKVAGRGRVPQIGEGAPGNP